MDPIMERYQALEDKVASSLPNLNKERLFAAFTYADEEHDGQLRKDGSPYITHPLAVAEIVADLGLDADSVVAALACAEDRGLSLEEAVVLSTAAGAANVMCSGTQAAEYSVVQSLMPRVVWRAL